MAKHPRFLSPKRPGSYSDRDLDCQTAIEDVFKTIADYAVAAGWAEREVASALIELAHNHWFALDARDRMLEQAADTNTRKSKVH
ncbi:MAG TPA: hypothetical protein VGO04_12480 [Ensifer sp.]|jgi:hypothetical protein|uniref:hypothetical protein n=1 Tax=Ensifer sp. TaxID=1872086 RepID=UPI002E0DD3F0|nr:hypothetical protein [Ensifer sp.]